MAKFIVGFLAGLMAWGVIRMLSHDEWHFMPTLEPEPEYWGEWSDWLNEGNH